MEAANQAVKNIFSLNLFSNVEINPRPDEKNEGGVVVEIKLREADRKSAEVSTEWSIVPGAGGAPSLVYMAFFLSSKFLTLYKVFH